MQAKPDLTLAKLWEMLVLPVHLSTLHEALAEIVKHITPMPSANYLRSARYAIQAK